MRHRYTLASIFISFAASSCAGSVDISAAIAKQFVSTKGASVNLAEAFPDAWEKVCVLGPYSNNDVARQALGFDWDAQGKTSILVNEGISVLLFVRSNNVVAYVEHPRNKGDFSNLTTKCYQREHAVFSQDAAPRNGWPGLFPKSGA